MTDPFDALRHRPEPQEPRPSFVRALRRRLVEELGLDEAPAVPTVDLPERKSMTTTEPSPTTTGNTTTAVAVPYLAVSDGAGALDWYARAFGAVEQFRVVGDDGRLGHSEFTIDGARFMLSDEYPDDGVVSPTTLGGTIIDPYGHRWMLSTPTEDIDLTEYQQRSGGGFEVQVTPDAASSPQETGGIWAVAFYRDAPANPRRPTTTPRASPSPSRIQRATVGSSAPTPAPTDPRAALAIPP